MLKNGTLGNSGQIKVSGTGNALDGETVTNTGGIEVLGLGALTLDQLTTVANGGGTITVDSTGALTLNGAIITGGTLSISGTLDLENATVNGGTLGGAGTIATASGNTDSTLNGVTIASGTLVTGGRHAGPDRDHHQQRRDRRRHHRHRRPGERHHQWRHAGRHRHDRDGGHQHRQHAERRHHCQRHAGDGGGRHAGPDRDHHQQRRDRRHDGKLDLENATVSSYVLLGAASDVSGSLDPVDAMALAVFRQIRQALTNLKPGEVREQADRPVRVGLVAASQESLGRMEGFFAPHRLSPDRRTEALQILIRGGGPSCDVQIYESSLLRPAKAFSFDPEAPEDCVRRIVRKREDLMLPLARRLDPFRKEVAHHVIRTVAKENALFCLVTALPDVVPSLASIPWAVGEYGSDAAFLTMNQIRMGFLLAAASDRVVGYREQRSEIASIAMGAFGWRALARELVAKVPFGGGLIPKAAIAWAGTFVAGLSLERLYRLGYGFTRIERRTAYEDAFENGKQIAGMLLESLKPQRKAV